MMLKLRFVAGVLIFVSLLTSCSSDPYANAGKCENPGESKFIDTRVAVCTGIESKSKWYLEGKYFDDTLLLAKTKYLSFVLDDALKAKLAAANLTFDDFIRVYEQSKIRIDELAKFANNDSRWDSLLEAKSNLDDAQIEQDYLFRERFTLSDSYRKGKASQSEAYKAQQEQIEHLNGPHALALSNFEAKVNVMSASLSSIYSITDRDLLLVFLTNYVKSIK
jgi:hypothetical protein